MKKVVSIATVQIVVGLQDPAASDMISEAMSVLLADNFILDWQYAKLGSQYLYPTKKVIISKGKYKEGDAF